MPEQARQSTTFNKGHKRGLRTEFADNAKGGIAAKSGVDAQLGQSNVSGDDFSHCSWVERPWVGFDTETTGIDNSVDHIITASLIDFDPRHIGPDDTPSFPVLQAPVNPRQPHEPVAHNWIANPGVDIPAKSTAVHGLTTKDVQRLGDDPKKVYERVAQLITQRWAQGIPVVAFNAGYDLIILENNLRRHGLQPLLERGDVKTRLVVDPLILDRALDPYRKGKRKLVDLLKHYQIDIPESLHDAEVDTLATLYLLRKMVAKYSTLAQMSDDELLQWQADQHNKWASGLNQWKQSKGYAGMIEEVWDVGKFLGIAHEE